MNGIINNLIHRLWAKAASNGTYDSKQWEQLSRGVTELQKAIKEERKRANYWQALHFEKTNTPPKKGTVLKRVYMAADEFLGLLYGHHKELPADPPASRTVIRAMDTDTGELQTEISIDAGTQVQVFWWQQ